MNARLLARGLAGLAALALLGCVVDPEGGKPTDSQGYRSPDAVCDSFFAALERRDFKIAVACLDPDSVTRLAGSCAWSGLCERDEIPRAWAKSWRLRPEERLSDEQRRARELAKVQLSDVLDRHGLTSAAVARLQKQATEQAARDSVAALIGDQPGFVADYFEVTHKADPRWKRDHAPRPRLVDVAISSDDRSASGEVVYPYEFVDKGARRDNTQPVTFVKLGAADWRIVHSAGLHIVP